MFLDYDYYLFFFFQVPLHRACALELYKGWMDEGQGLEARLGGIDRLDLHTPLLLNGQIRALAMRPAARTKLGNRTNKVACKSVFESKPLPRSSNVVNRSAAGRVDLRLSSVEIYFIFTFDEF